MKIFNFAESAEDDQSLSMNVLLGCTGSTAADKISYNSYPKHKLTCMYILYYIIDNKPLVCVRAGAHMCGCSNFCSNRCGKIFRNVRVRL